jgi:hypothetical protein
MTGGGGGTGGDISFLAGVLGDSDDGFLTSAYFAGSATAGGFESAAETSVLAFGSTYTVADGVVLAAYSAQFVVTKRRSNK